MIALHEKQLPVFGITHPAIVAGRRARGGRGRPRRGPAARQPPLRAAVIHRRGA